MGGIVGGALSLVGAVAGASASKSAANTQSDAAIQAANINATATDKTIQFQKDALAQSRSDLSPYRNIGSDALVTLRQLMGLPAGSPTSQTSSSMASDGSQLPAWIDQNRYATDSQYKSAVDSESSSLKQTYGYGVDNPAYSKDPSQLTAEINSKLGQFPAGTVQAPTSPAASGGMSPTDIMKLDPGYQFRLNQGLQSIDQASAARMGPGLNGATLKELQNYGSDYASSEFGNIFARLSGTANLGESAAAGSANLTGAAANAVGSATMGGAANAGNYLTQGANASAAGTVGAANAFSGASNNIMQQYTLRSILGGGTQAPAPVSTGSATMNSPYLVSEVVPGQYSTDNVQYG